VALPVAVANASADAVRTAKLRLTKAGGQGAVREFVELLLRARGDWDAQVERYVASRSEER
jgi:3-deoxy-D-manno-octulosonate 8-phosphate phosphatase (KDO 8-P phosphatase)